MSKARPCPDGDSPDLERGEEPGGNEIDGSQDLFPLRPPARVHSDHAHEMPGVEETHAVDWLRLPHWQLVKRLKLGDQEALAWIMETYRGALLRYATRLSTGSADPEDIVQEAFFRLWSRRGSLRPTGSIRAFLFISVRTIARDEYRRWGRRRRSSAQDPLPDRPAPDDPSEDAQGSELLLSLNEALGTLSPRRQQVFRMIRLEGRSIEEAAKALNLAPRTVKNTMSAALAELKKRLGPFLE